MTFRQAIAYECQDMKDFFKSWTVLLRALRLMTRMFMIVESVVGSKRNVLPLLRNFVGLLVVISTNLVK